MHATHALALCQPGTERWLKEEVARTRPDLRPGFQRPGLVTFRAERGFGPDEVPESVFGRVWAASAGSPGDAGAIAATAGRVGARVLWVAPRDQGVPDEVAPARQAAADADAAAWEAAIVTASGGTLAVRTPRLGELVLDVVTSPGEAPVVGWHAHGALRHPAAAGRLVRELPGDVPSRAWAKVVEGLAFAGHPVRKGEGILEFGAAPGGGTRAFVEAGARVVAVDPQPLDAGVRALPGVTYVQAPIGEIALADLPRDAAWLACDAGIPPVHVLGAVRRILPVVKRDLRGFLWTLKLHDDATVRSLPKVFSQLGALGFGAVRARQLAANRRDVFVFATRRA